MKLRFFLPVIPFFLASCGTVSSMYLPKQSAQSDAEIAQRRAEIRAMENQDYQDARRKRQDAIEDLGTMQMNEAKAINKAYENRSKQTIQIFH